MMNKNNRERLKGLEARMEQRGDGVPEILYVIPVPRLGEECRDCRRKVPEISAAERAIFKGKVLVRHMDSRGEIETLNEYEGDPRPNMESAERRKERARTDREAVAAWRKDAPERARREAVWRPGEPRDVGPWAMHWEKPMRPGEWCVFCRRKIPALSASEREPNKPRTAAVDLVPR